MQARSHPRPSSPADRPDGPAPTATRTVRLRTAAVLALPAIALIALVAAGWQPLLELDERIARPLHSSAVENPGWVSTNRVLTDWVWDTWTMRLLLAAVAVHLLWRGERLLALWLVVSAAVGTLVQQGLKALLDRERPQWTNPVDSADFAAMPSGHAMTAALTCGLLLWVLRLRGTPRPWWPIAVWAAAVSVAGVSFTRVFLGVHWLTDVVVGVLLGGALAACTAAAWRHDGPEGRGRGRRG